jgi:1-acyl-sn-glycerol-3-phosphate acyltransferase
MGASVTFGNISYALLRPLAWLLTHLVCRYHVSGRDHVPLSGPLLVAANHLSWYDPIILALVLPRRIWFFAKMEVFRWPIVGWLCRLTGQIPVHRGEADRAALEKALAYLREGRALIVFPEGTVERQEQMIAAHTGMAMLAVRTGATVLPVGHTGTRRILRSRRSWFPRVTIHIGEPLVPVMPEGVAHKVGLQMITQDVMMRIAGMLPPERRGVYTKPGV